MTPDDIRVSDLLTPEQVNAVWKRAFATLTHTALTDVCEKGATCKEVSQTVQAAQRILRGVQGELEMIEADEFEAMHHGLETQEQHPATF